MRAGGDDHCPLLRLLFRGWPGNPGEGIAPSSWISHGAKTSPVGKEVTAAGQRSPAGWVLAAIWGALPGRPGVITWWQNRPALLSFLRDFGCGGKECEMGDVQRPRVGVSAIIREGGRVLLIQRGKDPGRGLYAFPGGSLEFGEALHAGVAREAQEETGLSVVVRHLLYVSEVMPAPSGEGPHFVLLDFACDVSGGALRPGSDAADARWVDQAEAQVLPLTVNMASALADQSVRRFLEWG